MNAPEKMPTPTPCSNRLARFKDRTENTIYHIYLIQLFSNFLTGNSPFQPVASRALSSGSQMD